MFIRNLTEDKLVYKDHPLEIQLSPFKVTFIDDVVVSGATLKQVFGDKILILSLNQEKAEVQDLVKNAVEVGEQNLTKESVKEQPMVTDTREGTLAEEDKEVEKILDEVIKEVEDKAKKEIKRIRKRRKSVKK